ncbi:glutathione S-transferase C-terminal-like protein [Pisolithus croceorrhizus]|nr:glutathione S-transferase C-terminal-like protein [Pisolithus croceorrhizus]KAI6125009.1 glutathione S-transferase C-terminal-like protein [Pisolithus croceorrhizus]KAI6161910.1 glutathione S-transferase C-terminal-like protein [Pisolithus thermaeus]
MTLIGKMYSHIDQPQAKVILSAAALSNLGIELLPFEYGVTNKSPEFTEKFPLAKIPAFESLDGFRLTEGVAIARYVSSLVPDAGLLGRSTKETALVDQWVHFAESEIHMDASMIYAGVGLKLLPGYNADLHKWHEERVVRSLRFLDNYLETRPSGLLVGDGITLADVFLATVIQRVGQTICGVAEREQVYPHVFAHHAKVTSDARVKDVFGEPGFIEERLVCT